jgi:predicted MFS family arabinose efflux permease
MPSLLAMALAPAALATIDWLPGVAAVSFVIGVASAGAQLALFDALMRRIPVHQGVTFSSVDQSVQNLALVIGPNLGGILAVSLGVREALLVVAVVGFAAFALFLLDARARSIRARAGGAPGRSLEDTGLFDGRGAEI